MGDIMKKIFLTLLCLLTISIFAGATFASSDVDETLNNDFIQNSDDDNINISRSKDIGVSENSNGDIDYSKSNQTTHDANNINTLSNNDFKPCESSFIDSLFNWYDENPKNPLVPAEPKAPVNPICKLNDTHSNNNSDMEGPVTKLNNTNSNNDSDIEGPKSKLNITGPKDGLYLDVKGSKNRSWLYNTNDDIKKIWKWRSHYESRGKRWWKKLAFYAKSSGTGLGSSASSYVGEVGFELIDILEEQGIISKMAYGAVWLTVKFMKLFDDGICEDYWIVRLAYGDN